MMHASLLSSTAAATQPKGNSAEFGSAANPAEESFGPVMQQFSDAEAKAVSVASKSQPALDESRQKTPAKPVVQTTEPQQASVSVSPAASTPKVDSAAQNTELATSEPEVDELQIEQETLLALPQPNFTGAQRQLDQGKILPAGGNILPVVGQSTADGKGIAATAAGSTTTLDADGDIELPGFESGHSVEQAFASAAERYSSVPATTNRGNGDSGNPSLPRHPDALFTTALQKAGESAAGVELLNNFDALADAADVEITAELPSNLTNTAALAGADKLQALRPLQSTATAAGTSFQIDSQPGSVNWNNQVSDTIRWMSKAAISVAELKLNPAELGTIEIRIFTEDQQTRVSFVSSNAATREIIESTLPRLREMLQSSGLQLEQSDISHSNDSGKHARQENSVSRDAFFNEPEALQGHGLITRRPDLGQIDHYV